MTTNLNGTFAAVQAASRELALLPKHPLSCQKMKRTWHGWTRVTRSTTG